MDTDPWEYESELGSFNSYLRRRNLVYLHHCLKTSETISFLLAQTTFTGAYTILYPKFPGLFRTLSLKGATVKRSYNYTDLTGLRYVVEEPMPCNALEGISSLKIQGQELKECVFSL